MVAGATAAAAAATAGDSSDAEAEFQDDDPQAVAKRRYGVWEPAANDVVFATLAASYTERDASGSCDDVFKARKGTAALQKNNGKRKRGKSNAAAQHKPTAVRKRTEAVPVATTDDAVVDVLTADYVNSSSSGSSSSSRGSGSSILTVEASAIDKRKAANEREVIPVKAVVADDSDDTTEPMKEADIAVPEPETTAAAANTETVAVVAAAVAVATAAKAPADVADQQESTATNPVDSAVLTATESATAKTAPLSSSVSSDGGDTTVSAAAASSVAEEAE
jgi:hypothetical protein